ncbi:MAG: protein phosphatase 2C domain-containing protein [Muribaculaceae bacterium]|nr:protein phosphatase 2C domain-containing protein [Muribaculaceae bacterium]
MKQGRKNIRYVRTIVDDGQSKVLEVLHSIGETPTNTQLNDFQKWRIKDEWKRYKEERMNHYIIEQNKLNAISLSFPNGKKGEMYKQTVCLDTSKFQEIWFENLDQTGLHESIDTVNGTVTLSGIPFEAKDFEFKICIKLKGWDAGDPIIERKFSIAFNPDPRDLWKNIPVPANIEFPKRDEDSDYVLVPEFEGLPQKDIVVASKRGRSHAQEGKPRDDDFRVSFNPQNGWYILAVADGAGSAKYSREGSRVACETVEAYCKGRLAEQGDAFEEAVKAYANEKTQETLKPVIEKIHEILFKAATEAYKAISKKVEDCQGSAVLKDFSTTLLLAVCRKFSFGWFIASFGVGDGAIAIYDKNSDGIKLLNEPDGGEYAGQTRFLTMDSIFRDKTRIKMSIVADFTALMLMTDGISDPFFETDANLAKKEKWDALWTDLSSSVEFSDDNEQSQYQLLNWLDFWSPGNHDDRTLAILY